MNHLILPTQIYNKSYLDKNNTYILYEHPHYYNDFNYNKKKLVLLKSSMLYYYDYLLEHNYHVKYCGVTDNINKYIKSNEKYYIFAPIDNINLPKNYIILDTPNFLLTNADLEDYSYKTKSFHFYGFYNYVKKTINYLTNVKSQDKENRNKYDYEIEVLSLPSNKDDSYYIDKGIRWVNRYYKTNLGNTNNFIFPVSHKTSKKWLNHFLSKNFDYFGKYQDSIDNNYNYLFHSVLSSSINIGLLNPSEIIDEIISNYNKTNISSKEGYIRQLCWRELCRYTYLYIDFDSKNYFNCNSKLNKKWYEGSLDVPPVDDAIVMAIDTAYSHHINRLMVIGNFMTLNEIHPNNIFNWFMEVYIDSYLWVMSMNIDMATFRTGGLTTKRPYISSSNYIIKMSNYPKDEWCDYWDELYDSFLKKHKKKLWKYRYYFRRL
jgi:deoxyribodipyrimidine photolyase-related protein